MEEAVDVGRAAVTNGGPGALVAVVRGEAEAPERVVAGAAEDEAAVAPALEHAILRGAVEASEGRDAAVEEQAGERVLEEAEQAVDVALRLGRRARERRVHGLGDRCGIGVGLIDHAGGDGDHHLEAALVERAEPLRLRGPASRGVERERAAAAEEQERAAEEASLHEAAPIHAATIALIAAAAVTRARRRRRGAGCGAA